MKNDKTATSSGAQIDNLIAQIRHLLESEYKRGANDSLQTLAKILGKGEQESLPLLPLKGDRVPRGSAKAFVERVLTDTPKSIAEIRAEAKTRIEKLLSYQTVRLELERGKKEKRYKRLANGKWST